jgi:hypothetical protein
VTYRAPSAPEPKREREQARGVVVRMPESPEEETQRMARERAAFVREESRQLAEALEAERLLFDRIVRVAGGVVTLLALVLAVMAPLNVRGATVSGMGLVCGPLALLLVGQGGTRAENIPNWLKWTYFGGALLGTAIGATLLH